MASLFATPSQTSKAPSITARHRPMTIDAFVGLAGPRKQLARIVANPIDAAFMFSGPSGTGKTSMALAFASELRYEVVRIASQTCTLAAVNQLRDDLTYYPPIGLRGRLLLIDEADIMTRAAQDAFLSILDEIPADTIFVFTSNDCSALEARFMSRVQQIHFSSEGFAKPDQVPALLERIWRAEMPDTATRPNFSRLIRDANNNVRAALMALQGEMQSA